MTLRLLCLLLLALLPGPALAIDPPAQVLQGTRAHSGLLNVHVDRRQGRILLALPAPDAAGISGRFVYVSALESGLGSAPVGLDRGLASGSKILVFRRVGRRVVAEIENHRFRAPGGTLKRSSGASAAVCT